jgi:predicted ATPase
VDAAQPDATRGAAPVRVRVTVQVLSIDIKNFRCFESFSLEFGGASRLIIGSNGMGKTTLLHALHMAMQGGRGITLEDLRDSSIPLEIIAKLGAVPPTAHGVFHDAMTFETPPFLRVGVQATWDPAEAELEIVHGFPDAAWRRAGREARANLPVLMLNAQRDVGRLLTFTGTASLLDDLVRRLDIDEPLQDALAEVDSAAQRLSEAPEVEGMLSALRSELVRLIPDVDDPAYSIGVGLSDRRDLLRQFALRLKHEGPPRSLVHQAGGLGQLTISAVLLRLAELQPEAVLLIDEPEQALHPQVQRSLIAAFRDRQAQAVGVTHSASVLSEVDPREITRLRRGAAHDIEAVTPGLISDYDARRIRRYATAQTAEAYFAKTVIVVEGPSDHFAVREFAAKAGLPLDALGVSILPLDGADTFKTYLELLGPNGLGLRILGMCDADREQKWIKSLTEVGVAAHDRASLAAAGIQVCDPDLELELLSALTVAEVESVFETDGALQHFQTFSQQPAITGQTEDEKRCRYVKKDKVRWAPLLADAVDPTNVPSPVVSLLASI